MSGFILTIKWRQTCNRCSVGDRGADQWRAHNKTTTYTTKRAPYWPINTHTTCISHPTMGASLQYAQVKTCSCTYTHMLGFVIALRPQTPKHIRGGWSRYTDISEPVDGGVGTLQLWTTWTILSVKMDRENSLTLLWPEWGSNPIPSLICQKITQHIDRHAISGGKTTDGKNLKKKKIKICTVNIPCIWSCKTIIVSLMHNTWARTRTH
jgi:hypothetical protein